MPGDEERLLAALRFVQEQVRYLGMETGTGEFEPAASATVFERRYGDCKDKTLLLVTILRDLNIQAWPVLVNTARLGTVTELHPSPALFDHAITAAEMIAARTAVTQTFQVGNLGAETLLRMVMDASGPDANQLRAQFATEPGADLERERLNDEAAYYPVIRANEPLSFTDDPERNKVEIVESNAIKNMWTRSADDTGYRCYFYSPGGECAVAKTSRVDSVDATGPGVSGGTDLARGSRATGPLPFHSRDSDDR